MQKDLLNKRAIITGGGHGLGLEIARHYINAGSNIVICSRSEVDLINASEVLKGLLQDGQRLLYKVADISREADVIALTEYAVSELGGCDILVNNAGVYGPMGDIEEIDWADWVQAININLLGSILMCKFVIPYLKKQKYGKIIQLSGGGATQPMPRISAYAVSKAGIVRFIETLAQEVREYGIDVNSIAPGALNTSMLDEVLAAGSDKVGVDFYQKSLKQKQAGGTPLNVAAELAVFLASSDSDGVTGKLISAVWDEWRNFPAHLEELQSSDVYTLRRITARDRNFDWGDK